MDQTSHKPLVFMFSGQGSQYYQMARELFEQLPAFRRHLLQLDEVASRLLRQSVVQEIYNDKRNKADAFDRTLFTHPALFMVQTALANALREHGIVPDYLLGASLGSFVAAAVGGCFGFEAGLEVIIRQAEIVESRCQRGGMLAILADPQLYERSPSLHQNGELAGVNFSSHFVMSGPLDGLERAEKFLREQSITYQRLAVSYAFHSKSIDAAEEACRANLGTLDYRRSTIPILCCARTSFTEVMNADVLWQAVRTPIMFQRAIRYLEGKCSCRYLDLGPSGTLATMLKYNLSADTTSEVFPITTPFGRDLRNFERLKTTRGA